MYLVLHLLQNFLLLLVAPTVCLGQAGWCTTTTQNIELHRKQIPLQSIQFREVVTIPVVVHVVWKDKVDSISVAQIQSQIDALNRDFRKRNENQDLIPLQYRNRAADMEIEFCLASVDPSRNSTNGITYTQTDIDLIGTTKNIYYSDRGGKSAWNTKEYLNIWIGDFEGLAGKASFPNEGPAEEDGVVIDPKRFGTIGTVEAPYNLGRTATHEIGHYFNLLHLWGGEACDNDKLGCCVGFDQDCPCDDGISDTPPTIQTYLNSCPTQSDRPCGAEGMPMNYMTFANDACMALFTEGQKERVWATLNGPRVGLLNGDGCNKDIVAITQLNSKNDIRFFPNPASSYLTIIQDKSTFIYGHLYAANGTLINNFKLNHASKINLSNYPPGIYLLKFQSEHTIFIKKLIIER